LRDINRWNSSERPEIKVGKLLMSLLVRRSAPRLLRGVTRRILTGIGVGIASVALVASTGTVAGATSTITLTAAGSTFDQPFFTLAFYNYKHLTNATVDYASIGSGGGQKAFESNTVNFGASDVPMNATEIKLATAGTVLQVPVALGGEAISYNLYGVPGGIHMTGAVLAKIFLGQINNWDSATLKKLNPKVTFPTEAITVVHRATGSGTTYAFTTYLSKVSPTWKKKVGVTKTVAWPVGVGGQGNEGVAGLVADTPGAIGYVELDYALVNHFTYCEMQNPAGDWVSPSIKTVADEASLHPTLSATNFSITDLKAPSKSLDKTAKTAYPISTFSWALVYEQQKNQASGIAVVKVLQWLTHAGQKYAQQLSYVPLPPTVEAIAQSTLEKIVGPNGKQLLTSKLATKFANL
jgi:phosphate transport system substrate-binding protein